MYCSQVFLHNKYIFFCFSLTDDDEVSLKFHDYNCEPTTTDEKLRSAQKRIQELEQYIKNQKLEQFGLERFSSDPDKIRYYTGFACYGMLKAFFNSLSPCDANKIAWEQCQKLQSEDEISQRLRKNLLPIDQLFMFLHKIHLGSLDQDLADKFGVSESVVWRNTLSWTDFLYRILGPRPSWPSRGKVQDNMPPVFKCTFPDARIILNCTELKVQSSSISMLNSGTYSSGRSTTTLKALFGVTPSGVVSFISSLYSDCFTDNDIAKMSGILNLLEVGDAIMVDNDFLIEDLLIEKGCTLVCPYFLNVYKDQFTESENLDMSNLKTHVESALSRVREYGIFYSILSLNLSRCVKELWSVCCLLTNFKGPLIKEEVD